MSRSPSTGRSVRRDAAFGAAFMACLLITGSLTMVGCSTQSEVAAPRERPNLLLIITDDQRWDAVGYENPTLETPNLDALAERSLRFDNAFVTTTICPASRASILTGTLEREHRHTFKTEPIDEYLVERSYPALLGAAGYETGFVGKLGVKFDRKATELFDAYRSLWRRPYFQPDPDGGLAHVTELTARYAVEFIEERDRGRPFALTVSFNAPHADDPEAAQYFWPDAVGDLYRDTHFPPPPASDPAFFENQPDFLRHSMNRERWNWRFDTPEKYQSMLAGYYRMVSGVDRGVGEILAALERSGDQANTVVLFTSDNGYFIGERGFAGKWLGYDVALRVPLLIHDPRLPLKQQGSRSDVLALNIDLAPTLLDLADVEIPRTVTGASLAGHFDSPHEDWRTSFFFEHLFDEPTIPKHEGVRTERHKYIRYIETEPLHEELYDLRSDPDELRNLAIEPEHAPTLAALRSQCDEFAERYEARRLHLLSRSSEDAP